MINLGQENMNANHRLYEAEQNARQRTYREAGN